jgi:hypothetical protein
LAYQLDFNQKKNCMINKITKRLFIAASAVLLFQSCSKKDLIELSPDFALDALNNPSSLKQVEEVLTGTYATLRAANYYGSASGVGAGWSQMPDVMSDNLYEAVESLGNSRAMSDWLYTTNTPQVANLYAAPYNTIGNANIVIRDADKFQTALNQKKINRLKGQAFALRALAHFDLFRYFATKYDRNSTTDLALYYSKEFIVSSAIKPARMNNKEYYDNIFADITQAITLLSDIDAPINSTTALVRPFIDLNVVRALQARVYLYASMWTEAVAAATAVINARPLVNLNQTAFSGMYNQTNSGEIIWNVQFESGQLGPSFVVFSATSNRSFYRPVPEIATLDGASGLIRSNDIRYSAYFANSLGRLAVTKYKGKGTLSDGIANFPVFRTGEMYLIRAEANARIGGVSEVAALADLNTLRSARITGYVPLVGLVGANLLDEIAIERRRELVAEGHRFFDLKRTTRAITRGSTCGTAIALNGSCSLAPTAREWSLPMPEAVLNANKSVIQNPGY